MRTRSKIVLFMGIGGLSLAAYGFVSTLPSLTPGMVPTTTPTTTLPPGTPVGFNAARTEFVLPHNLGYLPAPELALAKADSAYAAGLGNAGDWTQMQVQLPWVSASENATGPPPVTMWEYSPGGEMTSSDPSGQSSQRLVMAIKTEIISENVSFVEDGVNAGTPRVSSSSVKVHASTLNSIQIEAGSVPYRTELLAPSMLEVLAAPVGTLAVGGTGLPAFCVPVPEAFLSHGFLSAAKVSTPKTEPVITAGPSAVFAGSNLDTGSPSYYDKGVASCNHFH